VPASALGRLGRPPRDDDVDGGTNDECDSALKQRADEELLRRDALGGKERKKKNKADAVPNQKNEAGV